MEREKGTPEEPILVTPLEAARMLSISRYTLYEEIKQGNIKAKRYGRLILIPYEEIKRFAASLDDFTVWQRGDE